MLSIEPWSLDIPMILLVLILIDPNKREYYVRRYKLIYEAKFKSRKIHGLLYCKYRRPWKIYTHKFEICKYINPSFFATS